MIFLVTAAISFALLSPEVRLWLQNTPPELNTAIGAFAGIVIGLLGIAAAIVYHARMKYESRQERQSDDARVLAAAIHGEITALTQWLSTQSASAAQAIGLVSQATVPILPVSPHGPYMKPMRDGWNS